MTLINCVVCKNKVKDYATIQDICITCYNKAEKISEVILK